MVTGAPVTSVLMQWSSSAASPLWALSSRWGVSVRVRECHQAQALFLTKLFKVKVKILPKQASHYWIQTCLKYWNGKVWNEIKYWWNRNVKHLYLEELECRICTLAKKEDENKKGKPYYSPFLILHYFNLINQPNGWENLLLYREWKLEWNSIWTSKSWTIHILLKIFL